METSLCEILKTFFFMLCRMFCTLEVYYKVFLWFILVVYFCGKNIFKGSQYEWMLIFL